MVAVPTLDDLALDPGAADALPSQVLVALLGKVKAIAGFLETAIFARLLAQSDVQPNKRDLAPDRTLNADEIAKELGVSRRLVFRNKRKFPFLRQPSPKSLVCSESDLRRWLKTQTA